MGGWSEDINSGVAVVWRIHSILVKVTRIGLYQIFSATFNSDPLKMIVIAEGRHLIRRINERLAHIQLLRRILPRKIPFFSSKSLRQNAVTPASCKNNSEYKTSRENECLEVKECM